MTAVGIDPSLTRTGIATADGKTITVATKAVAGYRRMGRLALIRDAVAESITEDVMLVAIEGYAHGASNQAHALGELGGIIRMAVWTRGVPFIDVAPNTLKKFACGNGRGGKPQVVANARERLGYEGFDDNEADALWLRELALHLIGDPVVELPKVHTDALRILRAEFGEY